MAISKNKRKLLIIFGSAILAVNLVLTILWFAIPWVFTYLGVPEDTIRRGKYTGYDAVVVTSNTSNKTLDELDSYHINYYEYKKGRILFGDGGIINEKDIHNEPKIYLCDGDYETELGSFIDYSGKYPLTICGAGEKETLIIGGSKLYSNSATGIKITAGKDKKLKNSVIKDLSIEGFGFGIELKHTDKTEITNVNIKENHYSGIVFENSDNSNLTNCIFEENGNPKTDDPVTPTDGFELKAGKNTIDITANWGYCAYDAVIIEKIG